MTLVGIVRFAFIITGAIVWAGVALFLAVAFLALCQHIWQAWGMSGRIVRETSTKTPRYKWWWGMIRGGPVTSLTTHEGHEVYWPGREPAGWYAD